MNAEDPDNDDLAGAFRRSYQTIIDQTPQRTSEWPPVPTYTPQQTRPRANRFRIAAAAVGALAVVFTIGWMLAPQEQPEPGAHFSVRTSPASTTDTTLTAPSSTVENAALAAAAAENPEVTDTRLTRIVGIYADQRIVDLRVQIQADGFCSWYSVSGTISNGQLEWVGGPVSSDARHCTNP